MNYTTFETALGTCGIAWTASGIRRIQLPERRRGQTAARLKEALPMFAESPAPGWVAHAIRRISGILEGKAHELSDLKLDLEGVSQVHRDILELTRGIPAGSTTTRGHIAGLAGRPRDARVVGQVLARNPVPLLVPCHRVLPHPGRAAGLSPAAGIVTRAQLLALEGIEVPSGSGSARNRRELPYNRSTAVRHLRSADQGLARVIDAAGPFRLQLDQVQSPFAALAESIVYQQLTGKAAATIHGRLVALVLPRRRLRPEDVLALPDERLRSAGLSRAKVAELKDLSSKTQDGVVPSMARLLKMDDSEIIARLTSIRGIGRWTVEMLLIFRLGRPDILPITDYGVQKGFKVAFGKRKLPTPAQLAKYGARWAPYRSVAAWYLWRAADKKTSAP